MSVNKDLNDANKAAQNLTSSTKAAAQATGELLNDSRNITEELKDQLGVRTKINEADKALLGLSKEITKQIQKNIVAAGQQGKIGDLIKQNEEKINRITQERSAIEGTLGKFKDSEIQKAKDLAKVNSERLKAQKTFEDLAAKQVLLDNNITEANLEQAIELEKQVNLAKDVVAAKEGEFASLVATASKEAQKLAILNQIEGVAKENLANSKAEEAIQNRKNKLLGITGNLLKGLQAIGGSIGAAFGLDEVAKEMNDVADAIARGNKEGNKLTVLGAGLKKAFLNLGDFIFSPEVLFKTFLDGFKEVDKAATDFARQTGQDMNSATDSLDSFNMGYVNMADYIKAATELTKELAFNANDIFSPEDILEVAQMTDEMGMAGKEAANLAKFSRANNMSVREQNEALIAGVNSFNAQNKSAVNARKVLDDVANVSTDIQMLYAGYPGELIKAASAAADLGLSLEQVDKIADSLLQFEESISAELKAELLTGKELNLEKAREAALTNDLETLSKEISKNIGTSADFAKMGRLEQESLAKAMGMSKQELAETLLAQDLKGKLDEDSLTAAQKQTLESMKNREAQEKIAQALGKIGQAFAPLVGFIADIVSNSYVIYSILGVALLTKLGGIKKAVASIGDGFKAAQSGVKSFFKFTEGGFSGMTKKTKAYGKTLSDAFKGGKSSGAGKEAAENIAKSADKTKGIQADQGKGIKGFLEGLGDGLASIGKQAGKVVKGGIALGIALVAIGGGFALAGMFIQNMDPTQMIAFAGALSIIGLTVAVMGKMGGEIIKGALALGILAVGLIPAAFAFSLLAGVDASSILAFAVALPILGLAVLGLGLIFTNPITMFLFGAGIAGLLALSLAIIPLAAAFGSLADANIEVIMGSLVGLASVAPDLMGIGVGLMSIAAGLGAISIAGLLAMPTLMALTALGSVSEGLGSIFGGGGETTAEDDPMVEKLNELNNNILKLISVVEAGGDVVMDGAVVGKTISMASSRIG